MKRKIIGHALNYIISIGFIFGLFFLSFRIGLALTDHSINFIEYLTYYYTKMFTLSREHLEYVDLNIIVLFFTVVLSALFFPLKLLINKVLNDFEKEERI